MIALFRYMSLKAGLATLESGQLRLGQIDKLNDPFDCFPALSHSAGQIYGPPDDLAKKMVAGFAEEVGILCFSAKWNEPILWSHYADSHRGMAFLFMMDENEKNLIKVKYSEDRAGYDLGKTVHAQTAADEYPEFLRVKSPSWGYEQEYRFFINPKTSIARDGYYYAPDFFSILGAVVLGLRCEQSPAYIKRFLEMNKRPDVKVWKVAMDPKKFLLTKVEV